MLADPADSLSRALSFWFNREIGTYAIDHTGADYLTHGLLAATLLITLAAVAAGYRLRRRPHLRVHAG